MDSPFPNELPLNGYLMETTSIYSTLTLVIDMKLSLPKDQLDDKDSTYSPI